jgi:hypothetical protein
VDESKMIFERDVTGSSSRRNSTQRPTTRKGRAVRGVSSDPSSGANSPTSPMASRPHLAFTSMTVESQEQPQPQSSSHHFFMGNDSIPPAPGYNGVQFQTPYQYPYAATASNVSPTYGAISASTPSSSPPRSPYAPMPILFDPFGTHGPFQRQQLRPYPPYPNPHPHPPHDDKNNFPQDNLDPQQYPGPGL